SLTGAGRASAVGVELAGVVVAGQRRVHVQCLWLQLEVVADLGEAGARLDAGRTSSSQPPSSWWTEC
nr:hypothetical protein [Micromonospora sp. DSM 115978]